MARSEEKKLIFSVHESTKMTYGGQKKNPERMPPVRIPVVGLRTKILFGERCLGKKF
jgi:hypothetical protein